jgi:GDP-L-fucose synthase
MTIELTDQDRILITGGHGMLGGALARQLSDNHGCKVLTPTRAELDLIDGSAVHAYFERERPTQVIHAAAKVFGLGGNMKFPGDMYYQNATMNSNVIEAARQFGAKKVTGVGTGAVYPVKYDGETMTEDMIWDGPPHGAEWAYAQAKRGMLVQLAAYHQQFGLDYSYSVCANLYGPHDLFNIEYGHVIPSLVAKFHRAKREGGSVSIWGTGVAVRDFAYVEDAAAAIIASHLSLTGPVNIASGHIHKIRDIVDALDEITGHKLTIEWDASKPDGQGRRFYSLERLQSIGFVPKYDLVEGLRKTWEWFELTYPDIRA